MCRGFGFVVYETKEEVRTHSQIPEHAELLVRPWVDALCVVVMQAEEAISRMDNTDLDGRTIRVGLRFPTHRSRGAASAVFCTVVC